MLFKKKKEREREKKRKKNDQTKKDFTNKKCFSYDHIGNIASNVLLNRDNSLCQSTSGSSVLDLSSTTSTILTPVSHTIKIPTGVKGPSPTGLVEIILGRSSLAMQGFTIIPGVIDLDYTGEIQRMISPPTKAL